MIFWSECLENSYEINYDSLHSFGSLCVRGMKILSSWSWQMAWFSLKFWKQLGKKKSGCWQNWKKKAMIRFRIFSLLSMTKERSTRWPIKRRDWANRSNLFSLQKRRKGTFLFLRYSWKNSKMECKCWLEKKDRTFHEEENTEVWESFDNTQTVPAV